MVRFAAAAIAIAILFVGQSANAQQILLLDFWSPNCGPCMQMKPVVHSLEQAGYPIRQIDTTRDGQTSRQFNVTQIPCFVMLVNGQETERKIGGTSSEDLQQMFERAKDEVRRRNGVHTQSPDTFSPSQGVSPAPSVAMGPAQQPTDQRWPPQDAPMIGSKNTSSTRGDTVNTPSSPALESQKSTGDVPSGLLAATVRLRVDDAQGRSYGTGTIIDTRSGEALVITCAHLFRESQGKSPVTADLYESAGNSVHVVGQATGQVINYDLTRDVALVSIRPDHPVSVATVAPPKSTISRLDRVVSIGCSNGNDPTVMESRITSLDRYQGSPNIEASGAPAIGRSGGGLFNMRGELVGICNNADPEGNEGIYAGLESIHEELDHLGLKEIYAKPDAAGPSARTVGGSGAAGGPSVVRGQEPPITPLANDAASPPARMDANDNQTKSAAPHSLSETEQAALEEIMSRAVSSEVVCIIRPKDHGGQSEVIQLDNVSPEFVRALRQRNSPAPITR